MPSCPCCSGSDYAHCCGQFIETGVSASTAEQLMRSRYVAFARGNIDYIEKTMRDQALAHFNRDDTQNWMSNTEFTGLSVLSVDSPDVVEFVATYRQAGKPGYLAERSEFRCDNGKWYYVRGKRYKPSPNLPCPCGSDRKFKKCCGQS